MEQVHVCPYCGKTTEVIFSFCPFCGSRLREVPSFEQIVSDSVARMQHVSKSKVCSRIEKLEEKIEILEHDLDQILTEKPQAT